MAASLTVGGCVLPMLNIGVVIPRTADALAGDGVQLVSPGSIGLVSTVLIAAVAPPAAPAARS